jgi:hypothetical protein
MNGVSSGRARRSRGAALAWGLSGLAAAALAVWGCRPTELPSPTLAPGIVWQRPLSGPSFGPYPIGQGDNAGALWSDGDSLRWLRGFDGQPLQSWPWPDDFRDLSWGQESVVAQADAIVLLGRQQLAVLQPGQSTQLIPYPEGGASFRSAHRDQGGILLSWRRDSGTIGPEANQIIRWKHGQWTILATAPGRMGLFDAPRSWKRGWLAVLRRGTHCELWWTDRGQLRHERLVGGDGTGHPPVTSSGVAYFASQDSAVAFDLTKGQRLWAKKLPDGFDMGVHGLNAGLQTWDLLSSRGWWLRLNPTQGTASSQGQIEPLWLDRWQCSPWSFTKSNLLYMWGFDKPTPVVLPSATSGLTSLSMGTTVLLNLGHSAVAFQP